MDLADLQREPATRFAPFPAPSSCQCRGMLAKIYSAAVYGIDAYDVEIEVTAFSRV